MMSIDVGICRFENLLTFFCSSGKSRLVREEDEHEDVDEDDPRISFTGVKSAKRKVMFNETLPMI